MATRSTVWVQVNENLARGIYIHWDGYPEGVGMTLAQNYTDIESVNELINLGSLSSLRATFDETVAYHRDRNEEDVIIYSCTSAAECAEYFEEYNYIFVDGHWFLISDNGEKIHMETLKLIS